MTDAPSPSRDLLWLVCCSAIVRIPIAWLVGPTPLAGDETSYFRHAAHALRTGRLSATGSRPPLNETVLAGWMTVISPDPAMLRIAVAAMGALLVIPVYRLGLSYGGPRVARWAAILCAIYPNFVFFSHGLWSETLFLLLLATGLALLADTLRSPSPARFALAGAVFGLGALTREVGVVVIIAAAGWILWSQRPLLRALPRAAAFGATAFAVILPWTIHLNRSDPSIDGFALVTRTTYLNLYIGNGVPERVRETYPELTPKKHYVLLGHSRRDRERHARDLVRESIRERMPTWPVEKLASELPKLFAPNSFATRRLLASPEGKRGHWAYRLRHPSGPRATTHGFRWVLVAIVAAGVLALAPLGAAGLVLSANSSRPLVGLFSATLLGLILPLIVAFASTRHRLPCMLIFLQGSAWLGVHGRAAWRDASRGRRVGAALAAGGLALLIASGLGGIASTGWH